MFGRSLKWGIKEGMNMDSREFDQYKKSIKNDEKLEKCVECNEVLRKHRHDLGKPKQVYFIDFRERKLLKLEEEDDLRFKRV